jgi:carboxyl-terminal processing protease
MKFTAILILAWASSQSYAFLAPRNRLSNAPLAISESGTVGTPTRLQTLSLSAKEEPEDGKDAREEAIEKAFFLNFKGIEWKKVRTAVLSLGAGTFLGAFGVFAFLMSPILYSESDSVPTQFSAESTSIQKPVTLFEDILIDLKQSYVDDVSTNRLFETAVSAMLKTLDPYTEFENLGAAKSMQESVSGKYGGVGMVISGQINKPVKSQMIDKNTGEEPGARRTLDVKQSMMGKEKKGVMVVDAFEGYAFDADIRVGDRILAIDGKDCTELDVDSVRNLLRGDPGTDVTIQIERDALEKPTPFSPKAEVTGEKQGKAVLTVTTKRQQVRMSDVRLATYLGDPNDGIGYIALSGFNAGASKDFGLAMLMLRYCSPHDLQGLVVDLRGNPGGLLDAAIDIASYLVPPDSTIVSAKNKKEPEIVYKSSVQSIRPPGMKLAILVNGGSASASEVVSGAIQDLDAGVIIGPSRTYGKGLVQKIVPLPYESALKYTVAKYYTPSGRCIQAVKYKGGRMAIVDGSAEVASTEGEEEESERPDLDNGATLIADSERKSFLTANGRAVRDGGGVEPDVKVDSIKAGISESALLTQNVYNDFAANYLARSDARNIFRQITTDEKQERASDSRFLAGGGAFDQYLVLPRSWRSAPTAAQARADSNLGAPKATEPSYQPRFQTSYRRGGGVRLSTAPSTSEQIFNSKLVAMTSPPKSADHPMPQPTAAAPVRKDGEDWESKLMALSPNKRKASTKAVSPNLSGDNLYKDFKGYVEERVKTGKLDFDYGLAAKVDVLEKEVRESGLTSVAKELSNAKALIGKGLLEDMDNNKDYVVDSIELSLLSRELPDRLLLYRNAVTDPQVDIARRVLTGSMSSAANAAKTPSLTIASTAEGADGSPSGVTTGISTVQAIPKEAADLVANENPVDGSKLKSFTGLYEALLAPGVHSNTANIALAAKSPADSPSVPSAAMEESP